MSLGKPGQTPVVTRPAPDERRLEHPEAALLELGAHAEAGEHRDDRLHVQGPDSPDLDLAAGDRGGDGPAAGLDEVAVDAVARPREASDPGDPERARALAGDLGPHAPQEAGELGDVRLAGGVADLGRPRGRGRGEERRLGGRDRGLVEVEGRAPEPFRGGENAPSRDLGEGAEGGEGAVVRRHRAPAGEVAAGLADGRPTGAGQERGHEEHGAADAGDERGVGIGGPELPAAHPERRRADALDLGPQALEEAAHGLDVADARGVLEHAAPRW